MSQQFVTVVSGLPRSGTSMMMKMLEAGAVPLLTDRARPPDADNPEGYFELELVRKLGVDVSWLDNAEGHAVKVISQLLSQLPESHCYRVVFMDRDIDEVLASQRAMLKRRGTGRTTTSDDDVMQSVFEKHLNDVREWSQQQRNFELLGVRFPAVHANPVSQAQRVSDFLGMDLDIARMAAAVDKRLYRQKSPSHHEDPLGVA